MKIAVITGASSGQGREFAKQIAARHPDLDEMWLISRNREKLSETADSLGVTCRVMPADLTQKAALEKYKEQLITSSPEVAFLVNAAGFGKFGSTHGIPLSEIDDMIELNIKAVVDMTLITLPYMSGGGRIINMSSVSAFSPLPYFNVYAASKAFILRFSRALNNEIKDSGVSVTAVCPYWVDTQFISVAKDVPNPGAVDNFRFIRPACVIVKKALDDAEDGRDISLYSAAEYSLRLMSKLFCDKLQMAVWNIFRN